MTNGPASSRWSYDPIATPPSRCRFFHGQVLAELLRTRQQLTRQQSSHTQRLQRILEVANIKLDSVITDLVGKNGRAMIEAMIAGYTNPAKLAALTDPWIEAWPEQLREALRGRRPIIIASRCASTWIRSRRPKPRSRRSISRSPP